MCVNFHNVNRLLYFVFIHYADCEQDTANPPQHLFRKVHT